MLQVAAVRAVIVVTAVSAVYKGRTEVPAQVEVEVAVLGQTSVIPLVLHWEEVEVVLDYMVREQAGMVD
jgi:hypothetical protein